MSRCPRCNYFVGFLFKAGFPSHVLCSGRGQRFYINDASGRLVSCDDHHSIPLITEKRIKYPPSPQFDLFGGAL